MKIGNSDWSDSLSSIDVENLTDMMGIEGISSVRNKGVLMTPEGGFSTVRTLS